jgi:hypothetical protein
MSEKIARLFSFLFHPILMPSYVLVILLNLNPVMSAMVPLHYKLILLGVVVLTTVISPLFILFLLHKLRIITSYYLASREERIYPILAVAIFFYVTYYLLRGVHVSLLFSYYMLGATLIAIVAFIVNFFHGISLHTLGTGGFTGLFIGMMLSFGADFTYLILAGILISGITGFARLKTNAHQPAEIYAGFLSGTVIMTVIVMLV